MTENCNCDTCKDKKCNCPICINSRAVIARIGGSKNSMSEATLTIRESRRDLAKVNTFTRFGDTVPMCAACGAVRVAEKGTTCVPCETVLENRAAMEAAYKRRRQFAIRALIVIGIIAVGVIASALGLGD